MEIDIDNEETLTITDSFKIPKIPTFIYFKNSVVCGSITGTNKSHIEDAINDNI